MADLDTQLPSSPKQDNDDVIKPPQTLEILDDDDDVTDAVIPSASPPPVNQYHRRANITRRKKAAYRKSTNKIHMKRIETLTKTLKPIIFNPRKKLDFVKHEEVLKKLGLFEFSRIEFDKELRNDLIAQLILNYDSKKRCSYVNDVRIVISRSDLARALKLPGPRVEKGSGGGIVEVDLDSDVFSDDAIDFVEDFVLNWLVLNEGDVREVGEMVRCVRDGHPEKMDVARLIWLCVEKELSASGKVVECYYAPHLQFLIKSQKPGVFVEVDEGKEAVKVVDDNEEKDEKVEVDENKGMDSVGVDKEIVNVKDVNEDNDEKDEAEVKGEKFEKVENDEAEVKDEMNENEVKEENDEKVEMNENVVNEENDEKVEMNENEVKEDYDEKVEKVEKDEKEEEVLEDEERGIDLTLGTEVEEIEDKEVKVDDVMVDAVEFKVDDAAEDEVEEEEQGNWKLDGMNNFGGEFSLQRCQSSDVNNYGGVKVEDVEEEEIEEVDDDEEEEEEEEGGEQVDEDGFNLDANDDSMDRDGLTGDFLQGVETNPMQYNNHGMSSMDLFGSRDGSFMSHGGPSFFNNGGKRVMEEEDDMHRIDGNNKRVRTNEMLDQNPNDFGFCMEQMQQWMEKARMVHQSKEQSYANSQYSQQMVMNQLQERQSYMEAVIKSKDEELEKKNTEVYRLERELYLMSDLLVGYRNALKDTRFKFTEYRKRAQLQEKPVYQDAGPGGLVLSTREIEGRRLKLEEDKMNFRIVVNNMEEEWAKMFKMYEESIVELANKLEYVGTEFEKLKDIATRLKETRKHQKQPSDEIDMTAEVEENEKSLDGEEIVADAEAKQEALDGEEIVSNVEVKQEALDGEEIVADADAEVKQEALDGEEIVADVEVKQEALDGEELAADVENKLESLDDNELGAEPEEMQTDEQDEVLEDDAQLEGDLLDADADADDPEEMQTDEQDEILENGTKLEGDLPEVDANVGADAVANANAGADVLSEVDANVGADDVANANAGADVDVDADESKEKGSSEEVRIDS